MGSHESRSDRNINYNAIQMYEPIVNYDNIEHKKLICPFCRKEHQEQEEIKSHILNEHSSLKCPFCKKIFKIEEKYGQNGEELFKEHILDEAKQEEEKKEEIDWEELKGIDKKYNYKDEKEFLMKFKNRRLIKQLSNIKNNMKSLNDIEQANNLIQAKEENIIEKEIDIYKDYYFYCINGNYFLPFNFKVTGFLFVIVNLVAIYQLIGLLKATEEEMLFGMQSIILEKNRTNITETIEDNYENLIFRNVPDFDFDILFLTSILGKLILKGCGFFKSSFFFMVFNSLIIYLLKIYPFPENRYHFSQFIQLFIYYLMLYISVGCISLFPHQIYFDFLKKYYKFRHDKERNDHSFFPHLVWTSTIAYVIHLFLNKFIDKQRYMNDFFYLNIIICISFTFASLLIYFCYSYGLKDKDRADNISERNIWKICGYLIYSERNIHGGIFGRGLRVAFRQFNLQTWENCPLRLFCPCFMPSCCQCIEICPCCPCCQCCRCCKVKASDLYQENEQLCYCYKVQQKCDWFTGLLFKNDILIFTLIYIFLELMTIGFDNKLEENLKSKSTTENTIILVIFIILFIIYTILYSNKIYFRAKYKLFGRCFDLKEENDLNKKIINLMGIADVNIILVIIFSGFSLFGRKELKNLTDNYLAIVPYSLTKFYYFSLMNSLVSEIDDDNVDLLSNSTVVSVILTLYNLATNIIIYIILDCSPDSLIFFQFILSCCFIIPLIIVSLYMITGQ